MNLRPPDASWLVCGLQPFSDKGMRLDVGRDPFRLKEGVRRVSLSSNPELDPVNVLGAARARTPRNESSETSTRGVLSVIPVETELTLATS